MMTETESDTEGPTWGDSATVEGDHKQVAEMAIMLHEQGKCVTISHGNFSARLYQDTEYEVVHNSENSYIKKAGEDIIHENVTDDHSLYVTEWRD